MGDIGIHNNSPVQGQNNGPHQTIIQVFVNSESVRQIIPQRDHDKASADVAIHNIILAELEDSSADVRFVAAQYLVALKDPNTISAIIIRLQIESDPTVRYWLAYALGRIGDKLVINALLEAKAREDNPFAQRGIDAGLKLLQKATNIPLRKEVIS